MGDNNRKPSRSRLKSAGGGEIVEVQGGHIIRSTGRKDRHSKVCTAKGPRDRRVRLAAHTAIQFYDVQDRLGYDRPSKAVDWLIHKAKAAIDELAQLPAWHPSLCEEPTEEKEEQQLKFGVDRSDLVVASSNSDAAPTSSFLPPSLDSDAIADTIKSFFPTGGASSGELSSSGMQFRRSDQDLRLSLQSFPDPILLHHQSQPHSELSGFEGWAEHHQQVAELSRSTVVQQLLGQSQNQFVSLSQRGPLQSSNSPSIRAWMDPSAITIASADHHPAVVPIYPSSMYGVGFGSGFHIPARIQGEEEKHDGYSDKPSSGSSDSRH